jgi:Gpi18-like mannosyltransferase
MKYLTSILPRFPVLLWLFIRVLSVPIALLVFSHSSARPISSVRTWLAPWYVWDTHYYVAIARNGYEAGNATANFHPLYPVISGLISVVTRDAVLSLLLVASVAGLLLTVASYRLARLDYDEVQATQGTALLLVSPFSLALFVPYNESLFLLFAVLCLLAARQRHFWLSGFCGALAALTRQQGIFLLLPLACEVWASSERKWPNKVAHWANWLAVLLVPVGYGVWIVYRALAINDVRADFSSVDKFIYSVMLSPTTFQVVEEQQFLLPWNAMWKAIRILWEGNVYWAAYLDATLGLAFIVMFVLAWPTLRRSYRIYSLVIVVVSLSFYPGPINPYLSLPRHLLLAFPVFLGFGARYKRRMFPLFVVILFLCQMGLLSLFVLQRWVL